MLGVSQSWRYRDGVCGTPVLGLPWLSRMAAFRPQAEAGCHRRCRSRCSLTHGCRGDAAGLPRGAALQSRAGLPDPSCHRDPPRLLWRQLNPNPMGLVRARCDGESRAGGRAGGDLLSRRRPGTAAPGPASPTPRLALHLLPLPLLRGRVVPLARGCGAARPGVRCCRLCSGAPLSFTPCLSPSPPRPLFSLSLSPARDSVSRWAPAPSGFALLVAGPARLSPRGSSCPRAEDG